MQQNQLLGTRYTKFGHVWLEYGFIYKMLFYDNKFLPIWQEKNVFVYNTMPVAF
jgi:hypothetical protein